jgi:hypothetical protein
MRTECSACVVARRQQRNADDEGATRRTMSAQNISSDTKIKAQLLLRRLRCSEGRITTMPRCHADDGPPFRDPLPDQGSNRTPWPRQIWAKYCCSQCCRLVAQHCQPHHPANKNGDEGTMAFANKERKVRKRVDEMKVPQSQGEKKENRPQLVFLSEVRTLKQRA